MLRATSHRCHDELMSIDVRVRASSWATLAAMTDLSLGPTSTGGATPTSSSSPLRKLLLGLGGFAFWPVFFVLFSGAPACMGFEEPTLATLSACPEVTTALGTPLRRSWMGMSCGNAETSDSFGQASWHFPVAGPSGSGSVDVVAERRGGPWVLYQANVEIDGRTIDALACARGAGMPMPGVPGMAGLPAPPPGMGPMTVEARTIAATVTTAAGTAPTSAGQPCEIRLSPGAGPFNCRAEIACGGVSLYGGSSTGGYLQCTRDAGGHLLAMDAENSTTSGDPMLTLTTGAGIGVLTDAGASGTWVVTLSYPAF